VDGPVTCIRARTSDRTAGGGRGAEALARHLGGTVVGDPPADPRPRDWDEDLRDAGPAFEAARAAVAPGSLITASDCSICMATFPEVLRRWPDVRFAWLDAHGDFNTPDTTPSGFLGGMCLAAACGRWDAGTATVPRDRVHLIGVRDLDPGEREEVEAAGLRRGLPEKGPVYVHLDVDVLDPEVLPSQFPVPGGLSAAEVRDALASLLNTDIVGLEVTAFEAPDDPAAMSGRVELIAGLLP
jgi:arginase family enzyme